MSIFFNHYKAGNAIHFNDIVAQSNETLTCVVGQWSADGMIAVYTPEGNIIRCISYHLRNSTFTFLNAVEAPGNDWVVFGTETVRNGQRIIVVRVNATGNVIWAKRYNIEDLTAPLQIIYLSKDEYVFGTRTQGIGLGTEDFLLVKINGSGDVVKAVKVEPSTNEVATGLTRTEGGFAVYGGFGGNGWDNFLVQFDTNLVATWSKLIGNKDYQFTKHVLCISDKEFIVTGEQGSTKDTFIYRYVPGATTVNATVYNSVSGEDEGFKRLARIVIPGEKDQYLLAAQVSSAVPSTYTRFQNNLSLMWHKRLVTDDPYVITDLHVHDDGNERVRVSGYNVGDDGESGLLIRTDHQFTLCKADRLSTPRATQVQFDVTNWEISPKETEVQTAELILTEIKDEPQKTELCPRNVIDLDEETLVQSPFVYLQAAGSDGEDDTPTGFHLRWDFRKTLSDQHIAKGSLSGNYGLYPATYGFNKDDDFIHIYRTPFDKQYYTEVNFNVQPGSYNTAGSVREWIYQNISPFGVSGGTPANVVLHFPDTAAYDAQAALTNPVASVINFLKQYTGEIHIRLDGKPSFRVEWEYGITNPGDIGNAKFRYEIVSLTDVTDNSTVELNERKVLTSDFSVAHVAVCEDIHYLRFDRKNVYPTKFRFYAYTDYLLGTNQAQAWSKIGDFALTTSMSPAYLRLENTATFQIDNLWPKFNEDNGTTGQFKVSVSNYQDRWSNSEGLSYGVMRYLDLSQSSSNYSATEAVPADPIGDLPDNSTMDISYFDMVQLAGLDYHFARMLGFGHIDTDSKAQSGDQFIYLMEYDTLADLEDGGGARFVKHLYMTPHLTLQDYKYPPLPVLKNTTYGLAVDNGTADPSLLTDDQGYTPFADIRFVNVNREAFQFEKTFETFFQHSAPFSLCDETETVSFGMEYALQGSQWKKPELLHDKLYSDYAGTPETLLIPNTAKNPVYRHQEKEEGVHCYALYSVNWFSRPSATSVQVCTDFTRFPKRNTLIPPVNLAVQLVQSEMPPLLTTSQEQADYATLVGDQTYLRVTFDYNYIHHQAYQFGNVAQFFFNKWEKQIVKGEILSVTQISDHRVQVTTGSYNILSSSPVETVQPTVTPGKESHFADSLFAVGGVNYRVESVITTSPGTGDNPTFILHQIRETNSVETTLGSNVWITTETYISPSAGQRFLVSENMGNAQNWDNKLAKSVYLESFSANDFLSVTSSSYNDGKYRIISAVLSGSNTDIKVDKPIVDAIADGEVEYNKVFRVIGFNGTNNGFLIAGDVTADFAGITDLVVFGSLDNDGDYTISSVSLSGGNTDVVVTGSIFLNSFVSAIGISKQVAVLSYNTVNNQITLAGDLTAELQPAYRETRSNTDGSTTELVMGGLVATCTIAEEPDVYTPDNVPAGSSPGDPVPGSRTGVYTLTFTGNPLPPHPDPEVSWFQGKVRVPENAAYLPTPLDSRTTALIKELNVQNVYEDSGNLMLVAVDPTFQVDPAGVPLVYDPSGEYVPVVTGSGIQVNYHPSYLLYLKADEAQIESGPAENAFNEASILPSFGEGSRKTFLGARAVDGFNNDPSTDDCASHVGTPAAIVAQEIRDPQPPNPPSGPLYATRPDFYGKSTYTMDISFNNIPYSVLVYKANERKILDTLYQPSTVETILEELALIPAPDIYFTQRWNDFVNVVLEPSGDPHAGEFLDYSNSNFRFPIPDNEEYILLQSFTAGTQINPFNGIDAPGSAVTFNIPELGITVPMEQAVKEAITGAFISQTKAPMIHEYIVDGDRTSNTPPVIRDENDNLIPPGGNGYNAFPFAVKLPGGDVRFCDYNIDGGSNSFYFYYAMELSDRQIKSAPSTIVGPIQLVNTRPAKEPSIKQVITQVENVADAIPASVCFKLEDYIASEGMARIDVYRSIDSIDALSVRTMELAAAIPVNGTIATTEICDTFAGLDYPLYGEDLHYRLIALRKITLEDGVTEEFIPSEPSRVVRATLVDPNNPPAPAIVSENGTTTSTELLNVVLKWDTTCYNGEYILDKLSPDGNWTEIYRVSSKEDAMQYPPLAGSTPDFGNYPETALLARVDGGGDRLFHTYRVRVINSSGRLNIEQKPLTLDQGCADLLQLGALVSYEDGNGFMLAEINNLQVEEGYNNPGGQITLTGLFSGVLPAGHNTVSELVVSVDDGQGNVSTQSSTSATNIFIFNDGDGDAPGMSLQLNSPHLSYTIQTTIKTDQCPDGQTLYYKLEYSWPLSQLEQIDEILSLTDGNAQTITVFEGGEIYNGFASPQSLTFTDITDLATLGLTFQKIELILSDVNNNTVTAEILSAGGSHTFNDGDFDVAGHEIDLISGNVEMVLKVKVFVNEVPAPLEHRYSFVYTYSYCEMLSTMSSPIGYSDANGNSFSPMSNQEITIGTGSPGTISIVDISGMLLPAGHNFGRIGVLLKDGIGGAEYKTINTVGGSVDFFNGDGGLSLNASNLIYSIGVTLYTDLCDSGQFFQYELTFNV